MRMNINVFLQRLKTSYVVYDFKIYCRAYKSPEIDILVRSL